MRLHNQFYDGTQRPHWAGPVTATTLKRPVRPGRPARTVQVSGVVVPVNVPGRYRKGGGSNQHTGGVGLGFPDLTCDLLKHPSIAKHWSSVEQTLADAAVHVMGWNSRSQPRYATGATPPQNALQLTLSGMLPNAGEEDKFNLDEHPLQGSLQKVFPIRDRSGRQLRMQSVGSPSTFQVGASSANFSRDPKQL